MVVREDGTKWACQSCLKGHRVSGCNHTDRELTLVPKKGRPVTQCQHCRLERKKRSAHVKCDCGEADKPHHSKEKCIHLREAEERAKAGFHEEPPLKLEDDVAHLTAVADEQGCCCHHGGKCSCSLIKKEPTGSSPPHGPAVPKPRLETAKSDGSITVFKNGHHKPVHHKNHAAHECGMPYKMPLPRAHTELTVSQAARRSADSLPLQTASLVDAGTSRAAKILPPLSTSLRRVSKSEQHSPQFSAAISDTSLSTIDFSNLGPTQTNQSVDSSTSEPISFPNYEPVSGMADGSYDPWSIIPSADSLSNNNPFAAWASQFDMSHVAQPALTAASSGTQSEIDEIPAIEDLYGFSMPSIQEDAVGNMPVDAVMNETSNGNRRSLPPNFFGNADFNVPEGSNHWRAPVSRAYDVATDNPKSAGADQVFTFNGWSTPPRLPATSLPPRAAGLNTGRPQSHSVGPSSAPSDDLMKQLFPDIDVTDRLFDRSSPPVLSQASKALMREQTISPPRSHPVDSPSGRDDYGRYVPQSWSDGSMSVPVEPFTDAYDLAVLEYSPGCSGPWPYQ